MKFRRSVFTQILPVAQPDAGLLLAKTAAFAQELLSVRLQHNAGAAVVRHAFRALVDGDPQPGRPELKTGCQPGERTTSLAI
jgi:hypothetical protein